MIDEPLSGRALEQRIHIAKGAAFLASGIVVGFGLLVVSATLLSMLRASPLMLLPVGVLVSIWLVLLLAAADRFRQAKEIGAPEDATPSLPPDPEATL